jgi:uncharacterized RDD family membrane protein YckC
MKITTSQKESLAESSAQSDIAYAQWWRRLAALVVDGTAFILTLWFTVQVWTWTYAYRINFQLLPNGGAVFDIPDASQAFVVLLVVSVLFSPIYFGLQEAGRHSASFGKRLLSIKVVRSNTSRLGYWRAATRALFHSLPGIGLAGDLLQPFTKRRQTLHDMLTDSMVIRAEGALNASIFDYTEKLLRYLLKCIFYVSMALLGLAIAVFMVLIAINWKDQPPRSEMNELYDWAPSPTAFVSNGYLVLLGQDAPPDADPAAAGKAILQAQLSEIDKQRGGTRLSFDKPTDAAPATALTMYLCNYQKQNCVDHYLSTRSSISSVLPQISTMQQRFGLIVDLKRFEVVMPPQVTVGGPNWRYLTDGSELARATALFEMADGKYKDGIQRFAKNAQFSRGLLQQATTLSSYMIAVGLVHRDMRFISEVIQKYPQLVSKDGQDLQQLTVPVASPDFNLEKSLAHERKRFLWSIRDIWRSPDRTWFGRFFMWALAQPNATENRIVTEFESYIHLAGVVADKYDTELDRTGLMRKAATRFGYPSNFYSNNPIGNLFCDAFLAGNNYFADIEKQHDLNGHIRLVALQLRLALDKTPRTEITRALSNFPVEYKDPYTQIPMQWDEATSEIRFRGRQKSNQNLEASSLYSVRVFK